MKQEKDFDFIKYYNAARNPDTHKGDFGRVFIIAGSEGMTGAAMLCAEASIRAGAGLVYLFSPGKILPIYEIGCKEAIKIKIGEDDTGIFKENHVQQVIKEIKKGGNKSCVVVGPGLGRDAQTVKFVRGLLFELSNIDIPVILDADGLNAYKNKQYNMATLPEKLIITPHTAELSRLMSFKAENIIGNREKAAIEASTEIKAITVLKGNKTLVCPRNALNEDDIYINSTGNAGMATGGSGDVLAGIIAGIIASDSQNIAYFDAVCCGVYVHGLCGDIASKKYGQRAIKASDLIEMLKYINCIEESNNGI